MSNHVLKNDHLTVTFNEMGGEMTSILDHNSKTEYLWDGKPEFWKRHAPILFPFVGSLKDKTYLYQGQYYPAPQHGFARDMNFTVTDKNDDELQFLLEANEKTLKIYPFPFQLELSYRLQGRRIICTWRVLNQGTSPMYFSIGGHPAFQCPIDPAEEQSNYFLSFDNEKPIQYQHIDENGLLNRNQTNMQHYLTTDHGILPIDSHMFDYDALIIEDHQCHRVSLLNPARVPYLTISFDAPLLGIWSPAKKNAPFICIEPWYGRCDADDFNGTLEEREYGNTLPAGETFETSYTIDIA